jgi:hypothetical protein
MRTGHSILRAFAGIIVAAVAVSTIGVPLGARQIRAGVLATWKDGETWTQYHDDTRETEKGLGLILGGSGGQMRLSFVARLAGRFPNKPPSTVAIEAAADPMGNPNTLRNPTLRFLVTPAPDDKAPPDQKRMVDEKPVVLELSDRMIVDNPAPGAMVNDAVARLKPEEFEAIAYAKAVKAHIFMVDVEFSAAQLKALQKYAESVFLKKN